MNKVIPTKTGFMLVVGHRMEILDIENMVRTLNSTTGVSWVVIPDSEYQEVEEIHAKLGREVAEILQKLKV